MPSLLTEKDMKKIKYDMKNYTREFEINDRAFYSNQNKEEVERRRRIVDEYQRSVSQNSFNDYLPTLEKSLRLMARK